MTYLDKPICAICSLICDGRTYKALDYRNIENRQLVFGHFAECRNCGSLRAEEKLDYDSLYSDRSSSNYAGIRSKLFLVLKQWYLVASSRRLLKHAPKSADILDFGCGSGELLNALKALQPTLRLTGSDIQEDRPTTLNSSISYLSISKLNNTSTFDLIICRHVLEHLENPLETLRLLRGLLKTNGKITIEVPNADSRLRDLLGFRWPGYFYPFHIHVFTETGLRKLAENAEMNIIELSFNDAPVLGMFFIGLGFPQYLARTLSLALYPMQRMVGIGTKRREALFMLLDKKC